MSSPEIKYKVRPVTANEFGNFLNAKEVDQACPECKKGKAAINIYEDQVAVLTSPLAKIDVEGSYKNVERQALPALSITCQNCGYVRTFHVETVTKWLDEQQAGEEHGNE